MGIEQQIAAIITPSAAAKGYSVVRVKRIGQHQDTLQIMIERQDGAQVTLDDCTSVSRLMGPVLAAEGVNTDEYNVEVSSTGLDRPLVTQEDFTRFAGKEVKITTAAPVEGRKRFRGTLLGEKDAVVQLQLADGGEAIAEIPFEAIAEAKLVITDAMLQNAPA